MMDYREFVDQVAKDIKDVLGDELQSVNVTARQVEKLQGESYYGISVQPEGSNIVIRMELPMMRPFRWLVMLWRMACSTVRM